MSKYTDFYYLSRKNYIINGNFDIWQRGTSQTSSGFGSDDRWVNANTGSTKTHSQQSFTVGQTDVPNNPKYFSRTVVTTGSGASDNCIKWQRIESVLTLSGETVTLSFWAKADSNKNIAIEFLQVFGTGGSPSSSVNGIGVTTVSLTTSWKRYSVTVNISSVSGKTLGTSDNDYLGCVFWFDAGSDYDSRTNSLGNQSGTFDIAQVQLEKGSVATPFEIRPIGLELSLCERYYEDSDGSAYGNAIFFNGYVVSGAVYRARKQFNTTKRRSPTVSLSNQAVLAFGSTPGTPSGVSTKGFQEERTATGNHNSGYFSTHWAADAEL